MKRDYYDVLGVARDAGQQRDQEGLPQGGPRVPPGRQPRGPGGRGQVQGAAEAYEILSDADSRAAYDRYGFDGPARPPDDRLRARLLPGPLQRLLRRRHVRQRAARLRAACGAPRAARRRRPAATTWRSRLDLTFAESVFGIAKEVEVEADAACETCGGTGAAPGTGREQCPQCNGSGRMREVSSLGGFGQFIRTSTCTVCRGRGTIVKEPCESCRGTGRLRADADGQGRGAGRHRPRPAPAPVGRRRRRRPGRPVRRPLRARDRRTRRALRARRRRPHLPPGHHHGRGRARARPSTSPRSTATSS